MAHAQPYNRLFKEPVSPRMLWMLVFCFQEVDHSQNHLRIDGQDFRRLMAQAEDHESRYKVCSKSHFKAVDVVHFSYMKNAVPPVSKAFWETVAL